MEQRNHQESLKDLRKLDRRIKEISLLLDDEKRNASRLHDLNDKLQDKLKTYRRQAEEAEEFASGSFSKLRRAQLDLEESNEKAAINNNNNNAENQNAKARVNIRSTHSLERTFLSSAPLNYNNNINKTRANSIKH